MTRKEYTAMENQGLILRSHNSILAVMRHLHRHGPDGIYRPEDEGMIVDATPVVVGAINSVMAFLMDDAGMSREDATAMVTEWVRTVADAKEAGAWMSEPVQGTA